MTTTTATKTGITQKKPFWKTKSQTCSWHYNTAGQELLITDEDNILFSLPNCISHVDYSGGIREYDQAGRLTTEICHHGSTMTYNTDGKMTNEQGSDIATTTYTTVYGDYVAYTPAN